MEQETLFTASKWSILMGLEEQARSPIELADILNTSVANISQQLRLLEMAGLVQSKRISNRDKGLPRVLYSLSGNHSYLISASKKFVDKKFLQLTERNKVILRIWFLGQPQLQYYLEKAFWYVDENLNDISGLYLNNTKGSLNITIVSDSSNLKSKIKNQKIKGPDGLTQEVKFDIISEKDFKKSKDDYYALYDPESLTKGGKYDE